MAHKKRGSAYFGLGQYQKAIDDYDKAVQLEPNYAEAYNNRGNVYDELDQHTKAEADKSRECALDSKYC